MFLFFVGIDMFAVFQYNSSPNITELKNDFTINQLRQETIISERDPNRATHIFVLEVGNQSTTKYNHAEYKVSIFSKSGDKMDFQTIPDYFSIHEPKETTKVALHYRTKTADFVNIDESKTEITLIALDKTPLLYMP